MQSLIEWYKLNTGIRVHDNVIIKESFDGSVSAGFGLYLNRGELFDTIDRNKDTQIVLLRIPKHNTFNINTLLEILKDRNQYDSIEDFENTNKIISNLFKKFTTFLSGNNLMNIFLSETTIIIFYFSIFSWMIKQNMFIPEQFKYYLMKVLQVTKIDSKYNYKLPILRDIYKQYPFMDTVEKHIEAYETFFYDNEIKIDEDTLLQLYFAITSRVLEIPEALANVNTKDDELKDTEDYVVSSTLVPILDFVNHSNQYTNAYFDIDRKTDDVLLVFDIEKYQSLPIKYTLTTGEYIEVYISYSKVEEVNHFLNVYGFLPKPNTGSDTKTFQSYTLSFDRDYLTKVPMSISNEDEDVNIRDFYKWFEISPAISLVNINGEWKISRDVQLLQVLLPFISKESNSFYWEYDKHYAKLLAYLNSLVEGLEEELGHVKFLYELYESHIRSRIQNPENDRVGVPQLAWILHKVEYQTESEDSKKSSDDSGKYSEDSEGDLEDSKKHLTYPLICRPSLETVMEYVYDKVKYDATPACFLSYLKDFCSSRLNILKEKSKLSIKTGNKIETGRIAIEERILQNLTDQLLAIINGEAPSQSLFCTNYDTPSRFPYLSKETKVLDCLSLNDINDDIDKNSVEDIDNLFKNEDMDYFSQYIHFFIDVSRGNIPYLEVEPN
ncbi:hypothetical protein TPHA_0E01820 [Tetrapisispora phaffii CBS 4417]|uniref:SET domain-containing protein n=1 Tax=Tetrapisispora phaffii (strain ATCC 24235 / CBS 4417 / NBRC 1672 / NRRL Y-8282 / UCD 70-5) TaxID=1071381 RepID=G8BTP7_TETPH|nr:hypothetical protein TPHA_0E01820 [Tetrapisispora phaffii CBS 4417]CCE63275.1 hypothetical protein TPHA_0E01820 [Tetrapisispora phaffii CBS 4417]